MYIENYEKISKDHVEILNKEGRNPFMVEEQWKELEDSTEKIIRGYLQPNMKILDVGVGLGRLLDRFRESKYDRYGMDISSEYLKISKSKGIKVCRSLIEDMPFKNDYFDVVVTTDVLEHVVDLNLVITNILNVLKEDGILIIRVPYKEDLSKYLVEDYPYDLVHIRSFDENYMKILIEKIFNQKLINFEKAGYLSGERKKCYKNNYFFRIFAKLFVLTNKTLGVKKLKNYYSLINEPCEVNFVIKKTSLKSKYL